MKKAVIPVLVALAVAASLQPEPAGADTAAVSYATTTQSRAVETFARLPLYITQGAPSSKVILDHQSVPQCEVTAGLYDGDTAEEYVELGAGGKYQNPAKVKAGQSRGALPEKAEYGTAPGPTASAACPTAVSGTGKASWGGIVTDQLSVETATTTSNAAKAANEPVVALM